MAAGDPKAFTNTTIAAMSTVKELVFVAADADTADLAQRFDFTPTGKNSKLLIGIKNTSGALAFSIAAGNGVFKAGAAKTGSVAENKTGVIQIETGPYMTGGVISITLTPASGTKLLTNHAAAVFAVELL